MRKVPSFSCEGKVWPASILSRTWSYSLWRCGRTFASRQRGALYIHCLVDGATRMGDAMRMRTITTASVIKALRRWMMQHGQISVLVTDNAAYCTSADLAEWCEDNGVNQKFIATYRHFGVGMVERYHQTLMTESESCVSYMEALGSTTLGMQ